MATQTQVAPLYKSGLPQPLQPTKEKPRIPVIDAKVTDEQLGLIKTVSVPVSLSKVHKLLVDPHSLHLYDRHTHALRKVVKHYANGFMLKDLVDVFKILNTCADRVEAHSVAYSEPLCQLLKVCSISYLKEKTSDEMLYKQTATECMSQLGYLMRCPDPAVQKSVCDTIMGIHKSKHSARPEVTGAAAGERFSACSTEFCLSIVEDSDISETLVKSLALIGRHDDVKLRVLAVLQKLSKRSAKMCGQMLSASAASRLASGLVERGGSEWAVGADGGSDATAEAAGSSRDDASAGQILFRSIEILWNLLEQSSPSDEQRLARQLGSLAAVSQLREAFLLLLHSCHSHYDRQLRNDILVLAILVASKVDNAPFVETGFVKELTLFATFQEVKSHHALVRHLKLSTNHEDFELKKLLVSLLVTLCKDSAVLPILSDGRLLLALFCYVKSNEATSAPQDWSPAQFEELQLHAIAALCTFAPLMVDDYMACQGNTRLLLLLEWCVSVTATDDYRGHGNSHHGAGGRGNKRAQMRLCVRLLRSIVSTRHATLLQDLVDQGAIGQISAILTSASNSKEADDEIDVEMQSDMLLILSTLCEGDSHRKELFGAEGVDVVTHYLRTDTAKFTAGLGHHRLVLTAVDCIWCAVVGCYLTEDLFLEKEGVFLLLDLLERSPKSMHDLVLGCLLDLCENSKAIPHVRTWRGSGRDDQGEATSAAHLFCKMWREEERHLGVKRAEGGSLGDLDRPLLGKLQEEHGIVSLPASCVSLAIADVSENMRAKLYAIFCKFGYTELAGLTTEDYVTLTVIEQYLNLKTGEVWSEVIGELELEGVRPVTPDREGIETVQRAALEDARSIAVIQRSLLQAQKQQDALDERERYADIRENHRQRANTIDRWTAFVTRTSNYGVLKAAKEKQEQSVDASRVHYRRGPGDVVHKVDAGKMQTTVFCGRKLTVESTPAELTGGKLAKYDPKTGTLVVD